MKWYLRRSLAAIFAACVLLVLASAWKSPPPTHAAASFCQLTWTPVSVPQASARDGLHDVYALSADDVWAVGTADGATLTEHWNGTAWSIVPSPNAPNGTNTLLAVYGSASDDVWAVGRNRLSDTESRALLLHWDGSAWTLLPEPLPDTNHWLADVSGLSADNVWAVGTYYQAPIIQNLVLHWDGSAWSQVPIPYAQAQLPDGLNAVAIIAADDIWAAGTGLFHWNGTNWQMQQDVYAEDVVAFGANDVWFAGAGINGFLHWNGAQWQTFAPGTSPYVGNFVALAGAASDDVYAFGSAYAHGSLGVSQHFNGAKWKEIPLPALSRNTHLNGATVVSATEAWAVGSFDSFLPPPSAHSVILHGALPCIVPLPKTPVLLSPSNQGVVNTTRPTLDWRNVKYAAFYRVQIRAASGAWNKKADVPESQYKTPKLERGKTYQWRARACNATGCSKWSAYFTFKVN